jgi:hypothetical protein
LVEDNVIPPNAVPFGEDKNGTPLYIARALLEVGYLFPQYHNTDHAISFRVGSVSIFCP